MEPFNARKKSPGWGTSAKMSLKRAWDLAESRGDRRIEPLHLLLATVKAQEGTVPRMLRAVDVDPAALLRRSEKVLLEGSREDYK